MRRSCASSKSAVSFQHSGEGDAVSRSAEYALDGWNSRSSWRSVCPRSPCMVWTRQFGTAVIYDVVPGSYLFVDVHHDIIPASGHGGSGAGTALCFGVECRRWKARRCRARESSWRCCWLQRQSASSDDNRTVEPQSPELQYPILSYLSKLLSQGYRSSTVSHQSTFD